MRWGAIGLMVISLTACTLGHPADDASGHEIYEQLCARCHGDDLSGGVGPDIGSGSYAAGETDEYLRFTIVNGRGRMPSFSTTLEDEQVDRLVAYLREVQGR